jgi:hypothetical protein
MSAEKNKRIKCLYGKQSNERVKNLETAGFNVKKIRLPNGDIVIMKRKKNNFFKETHMMKTTR